MLNEWLAPMPVDAFARTHLRRAPFARPEAAAGAVPLLTWGTLARVLGTEPAPDVLVAADGQLIDWPVPRTLLALRALMARGFGLVARNAERHDAGLAALARAFAQDVPGQVHVQLYATPAGTQTFGWHFDFEDVFIAQTAGAKDYYFRENTVCPEDMPGSHPNFSRIRSESSPLLSSRLLAGDWLYIPSRWWHLVRSLDDALSISIGVVPDPSVVGLANQPRPKSGPQVDVPPDFVRSSVAAETRPP
jgi:50S ribosomal protein L16 3-hydroxylase